MVRMNANNTITVLGQTEWFALQEIGYTYRSAGAATPCETRPIVI